MKLCQRIAFVSVALFATAASAQYVTSFESPTFTSGNISGQDSWTTASNPGTARVLTAEQIAADLTAGGLTPGTTVHSGSQALLVSGTAGSSATIRVISGFETEMQVVLDVWARPLTSGIVGGPIGTAVPNNVFLTMEDSAGVRAAAFRFGPTFIDYGTSTDTGTFFWQATDIAWNADTWYHLTLSVNYATQTYDFSIDEILKADDVRFYNIASNGFSQVRIFRGGNQPGMIVDDLSVQIPEPVASACLLSAAGVLLLARRRSS